ncbi:MSP domain protein [Necator americanus]|uniref:Major sperm protein n=1 Tax=Necator americanus TaxID=51031 RepID=W2U0J2_NECAM|nr:MSP domain protein [Necator americanus]ETN86812.1 MSP domain protein [Necator americanus]
MVQEDPEKPRAVQVGLACPVQSAPEHPLQEVPQEAELVTFVPNDKRQQTYVVLQNDSERPVMFKMKSTRPAVYKMKPVFGVIKPKEKYSIRLVYLGIKIGYRIPMNDRITIVLAAVAHKPGGSKEVDAQIMTEGEMIKRKLRILFKGVNDQKPDDDEEEKKASAETAHEQAVKDQQLYMNGYDEGYKAALLESTGSKEKEGPEKELERQQKTGIGKERAFQEGFKEGYKKAVALLKMTEKKEQKVSKEQLKSPSKEPAKPASKEGKEEQKGKYSRERGKAPSKEQVKAPSKEVVKRGSRLVSKEKIKAPSKERLSKEPVKGPSREAVKKKPSKEVVKAPPSKEEIKKPSKEPVRTPTTPPYWKPKEEKKQEKPSDGTNVMAKTPGGTDPALGEALRRKDIVHIGPTGKRQIVIVMYRDPKLPENLLSRSGDEDEAEGNGSDRTASVQVPPVIIRSK